MIIGSFNWICNNTSVKAGVKTPDHTIAASSSVLTKDYTQIIKPYSIIGGCPAKLIKENCSRVFDVNVEKELTKNPNMIKDLSDDEIMNITWSLVNY